MKKILWISRHKMTKEQYDDLKRIVDDDLCIIQWKDTVNSVSELKNIIDEVDFIAAVLPIDLMSELLKIADKKPVFRAVSYRKPKGEITISESGTEEPEFMFVHKNWQQIIDIKIFVKDF